LPSAGGVQARLRVLQLLVGELLLLAERRNLILEEADSSRRLLGRLRRLGAVVSVVVVTENHKQCQKTEFLAKNSMLILTIRKPRKPQTMPENRIPGLETLCSF
jgi:hypothetical protein